MRHDTNEWGTKEWGQTNGTRGEQWGGGRGEDAWIKEVILSSFFFIIIHTLTQQSRLTFLSCFHLLWYDEMLHEEEWDTKEWMGHIRMVSGWMEFTWSTHICLSHSSRVAPHPFTWTNPKSKTPWVVLHHLHTILHRGNVGWTNPNPKTKTGRIDPLYELFWIRLDWHSPTIPYSPSHFCSSSEAKGVSSFDSFKSCGIWILSEIGKPENQVCNVASLWSFR